MNTVTHALLPVLAARVLGRKLKLGWKDYLVIGVAGALPDLLNPHVTLDSRLNSWSHSLLGWGICTVAILLLSLFLRKKLPWSTAAIASFADVLHLFCDMIAGGINWPYPFATHVVGDYWVSPTLWVPADIFCVLACYFLFRVFAPRKNDKQT